MTNLLSVDVDRRMAQGLDERVERADELQRLLLLIGHLLDLQQGGERLELHPQGVEDRDGGYHRPLDLLGETQLHVHGREIEGDERPLVGELLFEVPLAGLEESRLGGPEVAEVPQQKTLLP